jgi:hypothetical protein
MTMHSRYRFAELSDSLKSGFLADEIVLALARAQKGEVLGEKDKNALCTAVSMLDSATQGHGWADNPRLSSETRASANFFGRAVSAMPTVYTSQAFLEQLKQFRETAFQLTKGETPEASQVHALRTFFFNAAQSELDRTEQLLRGEDSSDALEWMATAS